MSADQQQPLLSPADVSRHMGVPVATLYQWRSRRVGPPALRVGRHLRYRRVDVDEWLASRIDDRGRPA